MSPAVKLIIVQLVDMIGAMMRAMPQSRDPFPSLAPSNPRLSGADDRARVLTLELLERLQATPEFAIVGFSAELCRACRDVLIYRKRVFRGRWRDGGNGLVWSSPDSICHSRFAPDAADAARQTMFAILQFLEVRRNYGRTVF